jgi:hypothetical protein
MIFYKEDQNNTISKNFGARDIFQEEFEKHFQVLKPVVDQLSILETDVQNSFLGLQISFCGKKSTKNITGEENLGPQSKNPEKGGAAIGTGGTGGATEGAAGAAGGTEEQEQSASVPGRGGMGQKVGQRKVVDRGQGRGPGRGGDPRPVEQGKAGEGEVEVLAEFKVAEDGSYREGAKNIYSTKKHVPKMHLKKNSSHEPNQLVLFFGKPFPLHH